MTQDALFTASGRDVDADLLDLAEIQHGLLGRGQAVDLGLSESGWRRRTTNPGWIPVSPRVLRRRGSPPTDRQRALAACLDLGPDAYISHESAAALWGVPGYWLMPLQVIVVRGRRTSSGLATVHLPRHLPNRSPQWSRASRWFARVSCCWSWPTGCTPSSFVADWTGCGAAAS